MTEKKRFTLSQNSTFHSVHDNVENKPLGVFEFKDDEFPVYACFHRIIDLMNNLSDENEELKKEAEKYNEDAMSYQTLYEQQVEKNKKLNQLIKKIEDNLNKYKLINCLEYEDWKKEIWGRE